MQRIRTGLLALVVGIIALGTTVSAAQYDLKEITPEVQQAIEGRRSRYDDLNTLKSQGKLGENNQGLVEAINGDTESKRIAQAENANRLVIYQAIVQQNQLGNEGLALVKEAFASVLRDKATPGQSIQTPEGKWKQK